MIFMTNFRITQLFLWSIKLTIGLEISIECCPKPGLKSGQSSPIDK